MKPTSVKWKTIIGNLARVALGLIWLVSGIVKVLNFDQATIGVAAYDLIPANLLEVVAILQILVELILGLFLIAGIFIKPSAVVSIILLASYIAAIVSVGVRHKKIDCGCFSAGGYNASSGWATYALDIARDVGFIAVALLAFFWGTSWLHSARLYGKTPAQGADNTIDLESIGVQEVTLH